MSKFMCSVPDKIWAFIYAAAGCFLLVVGVHISCIPCILTGFSNIGFGIATIYISWGDETKRERDRRHLLMTFLIILVNAGNIALMENYGTSDINKNDEVKESIRAQDL